MRFSNISVFSFAVALFVSPAIDAASLFQKRQTVVPTHGTTVAPAAGSVISPGSEFPFFYQNANYCHSGYSPISVYLSVSPPTTADVTAGGGLADDSFIYKFGDYLIANFGLPSMGTVPPATLTMPALEAVSGTTLYLSVVETYFGCPPTGATWEGLETTTVLYG